MKSLFKYIILGIFVLVFNSCKKSGTGGDATVVAFPKHHGKAIKGATIYIKFKTNDMPSDILTNYDLKIVGDPNEDHIHIHGLRYGKYYLYAVGYDPDIAMQVTGGVPLTIKWKKRKKEIDIDIALTE